MSLTTGNYTHTALCSLSFTAGPLWFTKVFFEISVCVPQGDHCGVAKGIAFFQALDQNPEIHDSDYSGPLSLKQCTRSKVYLNLRSPQRLNGYHTLFSVGEGTQGDDVARITLGFLSLPTPNYLVPIYSWIKWGSFQQNQNLHI